MVERWFLAGGVAVLLALTVTFSVVLTTPDGVRMANPADGETVGLGLDLAGDAWFAPGPAALSAATVTASGPDLELSAAMQRVVVQGGGPGGSAPLPLARWKGRLEFPAAGAWTLVAEAKSTTGAVLRTAPRRVTVTREAEGAFRSFSPQHVFPLVLVLFLVVATFVSVTKRGELPRRLARTLAVLLWGNEVVYQTVWFLQGG